MFAGFQQTNVSWVPVLTFAVPGDLNVAYSYRSGNYRTVGNMGFLSFALTTSTFTFNTASGILIITGIPLMIPNFNISILSLGTLIWRGITKAGYTDITSVLYSSTNYIQFLCSGSGLSNTWIDSVDTPTGGTIVLRGMLTIFL